jgi:hypothetical protein
VDVRDQVGDTAGGMELTPEDKAAINGYTAEAGLHSNLKSLMGRKWFLDDYQAWKDARDRGEYIARKDSKWYKAITREFSKARRSAVARYSASNEDFRDRLRQERRINNAVKRGEYDQVQRLIDYGKQ